MPKCEQNPLKRIQQSIIQYLYKYNSNLNSLKFSPKEIQVEFFKIVIINLFLHKFYRRKEQNIKRKRKKMKNDCEK